MQKIVGFMGHIDSGKTTAALHLVMQRQFLRRPFARSLKTMLMAIGLSPSHVDGDLKEEPCDLLCGVTPRAALQSLGTEWGRQMIHQDLWISLWAIDVARTGKPVVADDVRFANEAAMIRKQGGIVVRIDRPSIGQTSKHASENEIDLIRPDALIRNTGNLDDLCAAIDEIVR